MDIIFFLQILFRFFLLGRFYIFYIFIFFLIDQLHAIERSISQMQIECKQYSFPCDWNVNVAVFC